MFDITPVTTPHETDCGATCMHMLLAYYGISENIETLRGECRTGVTGSTMGDLKRSGAARGLEMHAFRYDGAELATKNAPAIIWWRYRHFVLFCGCDDAGNVVIIDPDKGRYRMPLDSFSKLYVNIALFGEMPGEVEITDPVEAILAELEGAIV